MEKQLFEQFLQEFAPQLERKATQLNRASWLLETTGAGDAAVLRAELDEELNVLLSDPHIYQSLVQWQEENSLPKRELNVLLRSFKPNQISQELIAAMAKKQADLTQTYGQFRPLFEGKQISENGIRKLLRDERSVERRKGVWEVSKEIGKEMAPQILEIVSLRNQAATSLGYTNFFDMQLSLQEVDVDWLFSFLENLAERSEETYERVLAEVEQQLQQQFHVRAEELGPWAWSDPFCQEDPLDSKELDQLVEGIDILQASIGFYDQMGFDVRAILARSDNEEREGKSQHAFCMHIDRKGDIRTLNNVKPSIKWLETVLHELGHAVYEEGFDSSLPWLLKEPPHMIPTEAMALLAGRQAYTPDSLAILLKSTEGKSELMEKALLSLRRRQLIFSRWVLVMTHFERGLYQNPNQDLNALWWNCVHKYQKIRPPEGREGKWDWATKVHIGLAPVYYFSYLLGEVLASSILVAIQGKEEVAFCSKKTADFLRKKLFFPGNRMSWKELSEELTGSAFTADHWLKEFAPVP